MVAMIQRHVVAVLCWLSVLHLAAQVPVPFTSKDERFMVFSKGRFEKLEPRPPRQVFVQDGRVIYVDHEGHLRVFTSEGRGLHELETSGAEHLSVSRDHVAWQKGDTLKSLQGTKARVIATGVQRFSISDSLIVYHDSAQHVLNAIWRGQVLTIADIEQGTDAPQWSVGGNTLTFFDRAAHRLFLLHRGVVRLLADSTDMGIAVNGQDVVGYWDGQSEQFKVLHGSEGTVASELRPASAKAGRSMLAFVDGNGRLRCSTPDGLFTLTDTIPTAYWVQDDLLLYLQGGSLMLFHKDAPLMVEHYVPERWQVWDDRLVYLDINRELRGIEAGRRVRYGNEAAIPRFDLFGDAVVYPSPTGFITVVRKGKSYVY